MLYFSLFLNGFLLGGLIILFLFVGLFHSKYSDYLDSFERRVDYTFERYFKTPLFPKVK